MIKTMKRKNGVTLVEILVATGVLAMFMTSIFYTFRSGSESFSSGTWRVQSQKKLQMFLTRLRDYLEKANYANEIAPNGVNDPEELPIYLSSLAFDTNNDGKDVMFKCRGKNLDLLFCAVTEPYRAAQADFGVLEKNGSWLGVGVLCRNDQLILKANGNWDTFAADCSPPAEIRPANLARFPGRVGMNNILRLDDIESIHFSRPTSGVAIADKVSSSLKVKITLRRYRGGKPTESFVTEEIGIRLIERNHTVNTF